MNINLYIEKLHYLENDKNNKSKLKLNIYSDSILHKGDLEHLIMDKNRSYIYNLNALATFKTFDDVFFGIEDYIKDHNEYNTNISFFLNNHLFAYKKNKNDILHYNIDFPRYIIDEFSLNPSLKLKYKNKNEVYYLINENPNFNQDKSFYCSPLGNIFFESKEDVADNIVAYLNYTNKKKRIIDTYRVFINDGCFGFFQNGKLIIDAKKLSTEEPILYLKENKKMPTFEEIHDKELEVLNKYLDTNKDKLKTLLKNDIEKNKDHKKSIIPKKKIN